MIKRKEKQFFDNARLGMADHYLDNKKSEKVSKSGAIDSLLNAGIRKKRKLESTLNKDRSIFHAFVKIGNQDSKETKILVVSCGKLLL